MTFLTLLVLGLVVAGAIYLWTVGKQPAANEPLDQDMLRACLETLLYRGMHGGELQICVRNSEKKISLYKYVEAPGVAGIRTDLHGHGWAMDYLDAFRQELAGRGIKYVETLDSKPNQGVRVTIDFGQDLGLAQFVIVLLFERVLGAQLPRDGVGYFSEKVLPTDMPRLTGVARPSP